MPVGGEIHELLFFGVHGVRAASRSISLPFGKYDEVAIKGRLGDNGLVTRVPEWVAGTRNSPFACVRGTRITAMATVTVKQAGVSFQLRGRCGQTSLQFLSDVQTSTGKPQKVRISAQAALPSKATQLRESIRWLVEATDGAGDIGSTGPHEVFVLLGEPLQTCSHWKMTNYLTYERIKLLTGPTIAGDKSNIDDVAFAIMYHVNRHAGQCRSGVSTTVSFSKGGDGGQFWSLLDMKQCGHCGELSYLMECMNRLLGIPAMQKHVRGATTRRGIDEQLSYEQHSRGGEKRNCRQHGQETLILNFSRQAPPFAPNSGEGTCEVNGKLYSGILNLVGVPSGGRSAAHDVLLQCEQRYAPSGVRPPTPGASRSGQVFQMWATRADAKGNYGICNLSPQESGCGPPFPPVPALGPLQERTRTPNVRPHANVRTPNH